MIGIYISLCGVCMRQRVNRERASMCICVCVCVCVCVSYVCLCVCETVSMSVCVQACKHYTAWDFTISQL